MTEENSENTDESVVLLREVVKQQKTTLQGLDVMLSVLISIKRNVTFFAIVVAGGLVAGWNEYDLVADDLIFSGDPSIIGKSFSFAIFLACILSPIFFII